MYLKTSFGFATLPSHSVPPLHLLPPPHLKSSKSTTVERWFCFYLHSSFSKPCYSVNAGILFQSLIHWFVDIIHLRENKQEALSEVNCVKIEKIQISYILSSYHKSDSHIQFAQQGFLNDFFFLGSQQHFLHECRPLDLCLPIGKQNVKIQTLVHFHKYAHITVVSLILSYMHTLKV